MKKGLKSFGLLLFILCTASCTAQKELAAAKEAKAHSWKEAASKMPEKWYRSDDAKSVADSVLQYQTEIGGWSKNHDYVQGFDQKEWAKIKSTGIGATFDNGATLTEMRFLTKMYSKVKDARYLKAFNKGFNYILEAQYPNGGWPQFYPIRPGKSVAYNSHITYNDDAMLHVMQFLKDIADRNPFYAPMDESNEMKEKARKAFDKGLVCIFNTQIKVKGQPTVWCAQHDEFTLKPANARAYELASFSGAESVGITLLLMEIKNPSAEIINAVKSAVTWFENHKIEGIKLQSITNSEGQPDKIVVKDKNAPALWARFYDLDTEKPFFCDRDGIKRKTFAEMGYNRRNGYKWYTSAPEKLLKLYPDWAKKWKVN